LGEGKNLVLDKEVRRVSVEEKAFKLDLKDIALGSH
jgi:hypothetical protein